MSLRTITIIVLATSLAVVFIGAKPQGIARKAREGQEAASFLIGSELACQPNNCVAPTGTRYLCETGCQTAGYNCGNVTATCVCKCYTGGCFICI
ncbi:hypothetical protein AAVH_15342 [Aphelenchoides avenae]|nr:hypothetical protein AAVH_15342 [Aphelenchus avenae]